jgi:hypothetical protein
MSNEPTPKTDNFLSRNSSYMEKRAYMMELERELTEVTKQRDALAEALKECLERLEHHTEFGALVQADMSAMHSSREALQSLTPKP